MIRLWWVKWCMCAVKKGALELLELRVGCSSWILRPVWQPLRVWRNRTASNSDPGGDDKRRPAGVRLPSERDPHDSAPRASE
jgi:hypothetical protein